MIPTLLLVGLVIGAYVQDRRTARIAAGVVVALAIGWGALVGISESSGSTGVAGAALGLANLAVAALLATVVRRLIHRAMRPTPA